MTWPWICPAIGCPASPSPQKIQDVLAAIRASSKPIIYCGGGVIASGAAEELREFATKTGIPVAMTVHGLGAMPSDHYLSLNMLGMHGTVYANYAVNEADLLLAFGVRFDDRVTGKLSEFAKHGRIVHVDIDASEINKNKFAHIPIHTNVKEFLEVINPLVSAGDYRDWHQQIDEWRASDPMAYEQRDDVILPQYVLEQFSKLAKGDFIMTTGVGQHQMWAAQWTRLKHPAHVDHFRRTGIDGLRIARRDGSTGRLSRCPGRRHRRRWQLCHEHSGAGDRSLREACRSR